MLKFLTYLVASPLYPLLDIPWEGIILDADIYIAIFLANNEYSLYFVIPNAESYRSNLIM